MSKTWRKWCGLFSKFFFCIKKNDFSYITYVCWCVYNIYIYTVNEAKEKFKTFFVTSWGHNNMLFAFYIKKSVEQREYIL